LLIFEKEIMGRERGLKLQVSRGSKCAVLARGSRRL
jgi:hypothetical protein